jgi:hypothetical protein
VQGVGSTGMLTGSTLGTSIFASSSFYYIQDSMIQFFFALYLNVICVMLVYEGAPLRAI